MSNHKNSRVSPFYTSNKPSETSDDFMKEFITNLEKQSANSKKKDNELFGGRMTPNRNTKSKFSSVEEAVQDMQDRTGLTAFLKNKNVKLAQKNEDDNLIIYDLNVFHEHPELKTFIDNYIDDRPGAHIEEVVTAIPAGIKHNVQDKDINNDLRAYINTKIMQNQHLNKDDGNLNHPGLGKTDTTIDESFMDADIFSVLAPSKKF